MMAKGLIEAFSISRDNKVYDVNSSSGKSIPVLSSVYYGKKKLYFCRLSGRYVFDRMFRKRKKVKQSYKPEIDVVWYHNQLEENEKLATGIIVKFRVSLNDGLFCYFQGESDFDTPIWVHKLQQNTYIDSYEEYFWRTQKTYEPFDKYFDKLQVNGWKTYEDLVHRLDGRNIHRFRVSKEDNTLLFLDQKWSSQTGVASGVGKVILQGLDYTLMGRSNESFQVSWKILENGGVMMFVIFTYCINEVFFQKLYEILPMLFDITKRTFF